MTAKSPTSRFVFVIAILVLSALAWIGFRTMLGLMMLGYVDSAIGRVRTVVTAEDQFAKAHPKVGYTCDLSQLPRIGDIARLLAKDRKDNGYVFDIVGCQGAAPMMPNSTYRVTAGSLHTGQPAFCSDQSGIVRADYGGSVERCLSSGVPLGS
jgi:hypothetical protein